MKGVLTGRVLDVGFAAARERGIPSIVAPKDLSLRNIVAPPCSCQTL